VGFRGGLVQFLVQFDPPALGQTQIGTGGNRASSIYVYPLRFFYQIYLPLLASSRSLAASRSSFVMGLILIGPYRPLLVSQTSGRTGSYREPSDRVTPYTDPYLVTLYYCVIVAGLEPYL
jgi:hypothetical protein